MTIFEIVERVDAGHDVEIERKHWKTFYEQVTDKIPFWVCIIEFHEKTFILKRKDDATPSEGTG